MLWASKAKIYFILKNLFFVIKRKNMHFGSAIFPRIYFPLSGLSE